MINYQKVTTHKIDFLNFIDFKSFITSNEFSILVCECAGVFADVNEDVRNFV